MFAHPFCSLLVSLIEPRDERLVFLDPVEMRRESEIGDARAARELFPCREIARIERADTRFLREQDRIGGLPKLHGVGAIREPNAVLWVELATRDIARAEAFYGAVLGWRAEPFPAGPGQYRVLSVPGQQDGFGGLLEMDEQWEGVPSHWSIYLQVADVDATLDKAVALGGSVCVPAFDVPGVGRIARIDDPAGAGCYLMTPSPPG